MRRALTFSGVMLACVSAASAQDPGTAELIALVKSLQARVNVLERQAAERDVREPRRPRLPSPAIRTASGAPAVTGMLELPPVAPWTGFYIGASAGVGVPVSSLSTQSATVALPAAPPLLLTGTGSGTRAPGALAHARFGFNTQISPTFVAGLQGEIGLAAVPLNQAGSTTSRVGAGFAVNSAFLRAHLVWDAAIAGKIGVTLSDRAMIYALAGPAYGQIQENATNAAVSMCGVTAGAGLEYRLNGNWSATGEYRYSYLRSSGFNATASTFANGGFFAPTATITTAQNRLQASIHQLRFGVNRYFTLD